MTTPAGRPAGQPDVRLRILAMVESQVLSPEAATQMLDLLDQRDYQRAAEMPVWSGPRNIRIRITSVRSGRTDIDLTLPVGLIKSGIGIASRLIPGRLPELRPMQEIVDAGYIGPLIDVTDDDDHIEMFVEPRT